VNRAIRPVHEFSDDTNVFCCCFHSSPIIQPSSALANPASPAFVIDIHPAVPVLLHRHQPFQGCNHLLRPLKRFGGCMNHLHSQSSWLQSLYSVRFEGQITTLLWNLTACSHLAQIPGFGSFFGLSRFLSNLRSGMAVFARLDISNGRRHDANHAFNLVSSHRCLNVEEHHLFPNTG
jgi:hypothetical protein